MAELGIDIEEDLHLLDIRIKQLKRDYELYFCGTRPREPVNLRREIQKIINIWMNKRIQNTAARFRFNSLNARFFAFRQQWDRTLRAIESGTYKRHVFKAELHERERGIKPAKPGVDEKLLPEKADKETISAYIDTRMACGQGTSGLSESKVRAFLDKQREALKSKHGCSDVTFRVDVVDGKAKLKATPVRD